MLFRIALHRRMAIAAVATKVSVIPTVRGADAMSGALPTFWLNAAFLGREPETRHSAFGQIWTTLSRAD
jgi:hypothetical protein